MIVNTLRRILQLFAFLVLVPWLLFLFLSSTTTSWRYSHFYTPNAAAALHAYEVREKQAQIVLASAVAAKVKQRYVNFWAVDADRTPEGTPALQNNTCVMIMSAPRQVEYVSQCIASLYQALNHSLPVCFKPNQGMPCPVQFMVHFAGTRNQSRVLEPGGAAEAVITVIYGGENVSEKHRSLHQDAQQALDFAKVLTIAAARRACGLIVIIEDDTVVSPDLFTHLAVISERLQHNPSWGFVKLFVTDFWEGWEWNLYTAVLLTFSSSVFAIALSCIMGHLLADPSSILHKWGTQSGVSRLTSLSIIIYITILAGIAQYLLGKQHVHWWLCRPGDFAAVPSSVMTQGVAFPRRIAAPLRTYLSENYMWKPADVLIGEYALSQDMTIRVRPGVVQHIGVISSHTRKNQFSTVTSRLKTHKTDPQFPDPSYRLH